MIFAAVTMALVPILALALLTRRAVALPLAALAIAIGYWSITEALGRPKASRLALLERGADDVSLLAFHFIEGEAIYLWLILPDDPTPRAYALPWSQSDAENLMRAQGQAEADGTGMRVRSPFERSQGEPLARSEPPRPDPPKPAGSE